MPERCHNSDEDGKEETSAAIVDKPEDCDIIRGFPISLCGVFKGSPPLKITWKKGKNEVILGILIFLICYNFSRCLHNC